MPGDFVRTRLAATRGSRHPSYRRKDLRAAKPLPASRRAALHGRSAATAKVFSCPYHAWVVPARRLAAIGAAPQELSGSLQPRRSAEPHAADRPRRHLSRLRVRHAERKSGAAARPSRADDRGDRQSGGPRARRRGRDRDFELHAGISRKLEAASGKRRRHFPSELRAQLLGDAGAPRAGQCLDPRPGPDPRNAAGERLRHPPNGKASSSTGSLAATPS